MNVDVHTLSGAYALDALSPDEREVFREHLAACQACRDEVRELRAAAARMGAAQWSVPSPALRERVLETARRTPQLPPATPVTPVTPVTPASPMAPAASASSRTSAPTHRRWPALLAAAAAVVALVGGGVVAVESMGGADDQVVAEEELVAAADRVFGADDARTATVELDDGGTLTVGVSQGLNEMAVDTRDLPELDREHVYQLWTVRGEKMTSAAILTDTSSGAAMGLPEGDTKVAMTVEPAGGSESPTSEPIALVDPATV